jgi:hypothetical protein
MLLTKEQILNCDDTGIIEENVPEWGGKINLRPMSAANKNKLYNHLKSNNTEDKSGDTVMKNMDGWYELSVAFTVCDENGNLLFSEADIGVLANKNPDVIDRLAIIAQDISGLSKPQEDIIEDEKKS